jgi:hypothetical protein
VIETMSPAAYFALLGIGMLVLGVVAIAAVLAAFDLFDALMERLR